MRSRLILKLSLCCALALAGSGFGILTAHYAEKYNDEENALLEKYEYDLTNAKLKNEQIFELTKELLSHEISRQKYNYEKWKVESEDLPKERYMENNATKEDMEEFKNADKKYVGCRAGCGLLALEGTAAAVAFVVSAKKASEQPDEPYLPR